MPRSSSLARLLQVLIATQLAAAAAWFIWRAPESMLLALLGAVVVLAIGPIVLAFEFGILAAVGDPHAPRPTFRQMARAWWAEANQLHRVFYGRLPFRWRTPADQHGDTARGRQGVVFIHGFVCNRGFWTPWLARLRESGGPFVAVNLEPVFAPIEGYQQLVEDAVRKVEAATGRPPVLVCHSMGGLVARAWLRSIGGGAGRVAHVVTIGSPHHGTWVARFSHTPNGRQMRLHAEWLRELQADEAAVAAPPFTCWYSNCDNIVFPASTATLPGADNRLNAGSAHVAMAFHPEVVDHTLALVRRLDAT